MAVDEILGSAVTIVLSEVDPWRDRTLSASPCCYCGDNSQAGGPGDMGAGVCEGGPPQNAKTVKEGRKKGGRSEVGGAPRCGAQTQRDSAQR